MSRLYRTAVTFATIGFVLSLAGVLTKGAYPGVFGWLFFYFPFLWGLWIWCVFALEDEERKRWKLFFLWHMVNVSVLLLFMSFAIVVKDWSHSKGIEIVAFTAYFPVVIPTAFLFNLVPESVGNGISANFEGLVNLLGGGTGNAIAVWLGMSLIAVIQSLLLILLSRILSQRRNRNSVLK